jgi:hypothetical protein
MIVVLSSTARDRDQPWVGDPEFTAARPSALRAARTARCACTVGKTLAVTEELITCEAREFPSHWPRIGGMDFSWDHPIAAVELVWDCDSDTV